MSDAGATQYTFHFEATDDVKGCVNKIREAGMKVGLGIKPGTKVEVIEPFIKDVDMVLIMTVEPGFGGQKFMSDMMPKLAYLHEKYPDLNLEVDGGVGLNNIEICKENGANMFVCGTSIVGATDPGEVITKMKHMLTS